MELTQENLLKLVDQNNGIANSRDVCAENSWDHDKFVGIMNSLVSKSMLVGTKGTTEVRSLTKEGESVKSKGSPEVILFNSVSEGTTKSDVEVNIIYYFVKLSLNLIYFVTF